jgi:hypothetical protein
MSLTDWVEWDKSIVDDLFIKPPFNYNGDHSHFLQAEPQTKNYWVVGTAFDYALRLIVTNLNGSRKCTFPLSFPMVAEHGIRNHSKRRKYVDNFKDRIFNALKDNNLNITDYLSDCITLAKIESVFRSGKDYPDSLIFSVDDNDISDLRKLISIVNMKHWKAKKCFVLNPNFEQSSADIGGGDADLIIDNRLIDIKTTKELKFRRDYFRQLIGYHILNEREHGLYGHFKTLELYYSRYGVLFTFPAPKIHYTGECYHDNHPTIPLEQEFIDYVRDDFTEPIDYAWELIEDSITDYRKAANLK